MSRSRKKNTTKIPQPAPPDPYKNAPYFAKVKALTTLLRAESWLRERIMLGSHVGMMTEGALSERKAKEAVAEALALLNGEKDAEIRQWIDAETNALRVGTAEYALAGGGGGGAGGTIRVEAGKRAKRKKGAPHA